VALDQEVALLAVLGATVLLVVVVQAAVVVGFCREV
jgi:hypothetical protein